MTEIAFVINSLDIMQCDRNLWLKVSPFRTKEQPKERPDEKEIAEALMILSKEYLLFKPSQRRLMGACYIHKRKHQKCGKNCPRRISSENRKLQPVTESLL